MAETCVNVSYNRHTKSGGIDMKIDPDDSNPNMDMDEHAKTYSTFMKFTQYGIAAVVLILIGMAIFLV
jgi:hypothetical protein